MVIERAGAAARLRGLLERQGINHGVHRGHRVLLGGTAGQKSSDLESVGWFCWRMFEVSERSGGIERRWPSSIRFALNVVPGGFRHSTPFTGACGSTVRPGKWALSSLGASAPPSPAIFINIFILPSQVQVFGEFF